MLDYFEQGLKVSNNQDTITLSLLDGKIYVLNKMKAYDSSLVYSDKLIEVSRIQKNIYFEALGYYRKATNYRFLNNSEEAFRNYYISRQKSLSIGDTARAGKRSLEMANAQSRMADYTGSQQNATTALRMLAKEKDSSFISSAYNVIAIAYGNRDFPKDAIREYKNALRFSKSAADSLSYFNNIALVLVDQGNYAKALQTFENILSKSELADEDSKARFIDNYAYTKWRQDSTAKVIDDLTTALNIRLKINELDGLTTSYEHLSNYYEYKNPSKARIFAFRWLETAKTNSSKNSELNALKKIIKLTPAEESKKYTNRFISLNDSLQKAHLHAKNIFAKITFDEEQKQKEIRNLEAQTTLQGIKAQQMQNKLIILSLAGLLILVSGGFGFYYFRQKHKKEKLQEIHKTETRISKKIHDELANDIYNMMGTLEPVAAPEVLDKLEDIYSRTRDISRENSNINTGEFYIEQLLGVLSKATPTNAKLIIRGENSIAWKNLSSEKKIVIYRVLQELMVNMKKHSAASFVAIIFSKEEKFLKINYSDNGQGCELSAIKSGNGLRNVENRIFSVNGTITFETEEGKGLKSEILIPV